MPHNLLDQPLILEILEHLARHGAVNLHAVDEHRDRDEAVRLHVLVQLLRGGLVEDYGVVGFVLYCFLRKEEKSLAGLSRKNGVGDLKLTLPL